MEKFKKVKCCDCKHYISNKNVFHYNIYGFKKVKICKNCIKEELSYIYNNIDNVNHLEYDAETNKLNIKFKNNFKYLDTEEHIIKYKED